MATREPDRQLVLDQMVEHVVYEAAQLLRFRRYGNGWIGSLPVPHELALLAQRSMLEAALLHSRTLVEFLGDRHDDDRVVARDYLAGWTWRASRAIGAPVGDLHSRVAHLGVARRSVASQGGFSWRVWLDDSAPVILAGMRDFLVRLRDDDEHRYQQFLQPSSGGEVVDLLVELDAVLGPA